MPCDCGTSNPLETDRWRSVIGEKFNDCHLPPISNYATQETTMLKHITFFSTLAGFGFLFGVLSGTIVGAI
jgi:hypothetical protein